jgi:uncharacterized protein
MFHVAPFVFGRQASLLDFTDRRKETEQLSGNFSSLTNTILIAPRRWGKSSLIVHATKEAARRDKKIRYCILDLFGIRSEEEFYVQLTTAVLRATESKTSEILRLSGKYLKHIVPKISFSADESNFGLSFDWKEIKQHPTEILDLAEKIAEEKKVKLVVCIDEFQNIGMFENPLLFQKILRSSWQKHKHVAYCLYGSKHHMMLEVFASPSMPFYKFGDLLFLEKIGEKDWQEFITRRFRDTGKTISAENALHIARLAESHPFYVQQLAQLSWLRTKKECARTEIDTAFSSLTDQLGLLFQSQTDGLSNTQVNFLKAVIAEVKQYSSKETIALYRLGTSANVQKIKSALLEKEIIDIRNGVLSILDPVYKAWLKNIYFRS